MSFASMLAAAGVWPALPLTGYLLFARAQRTVGGDSFPAVSAFALMTAAGFAVWSVLLLGTATAGVYRADALGLLGWAVSCAALFIRFRTAEPQHGGGNPTSAARTASSSTTPVETQDRRRRERRHGSARTPMGVDANARGRGAATAALTANQGTTWDWVLAVGLVVAAILYLGFPTESIYGGRDEGVYANSAVHLAHHGHLDVLYPWPADADAIFSQTWVGFPGFYKTQSTMTLQFGHLFPVWLAQAYASFGAAGLFRLNAVFALLSVAVFYGVCRRALPHAYAVAATLFLALNPSQLWMARITLSEVAAQMFIWSGLLLLLEAVQTDSAGRARWAGVLFGLAAFVRFDSLLIAPLLLLGHVATRIVEEPTGKTSRLWIALYQTAGPTLLLAFAYLAVFSTLYLAERGSYIRPLATATAGATVLLLATIPVVVTTARRWLTARVTLTVFGLGWFAAAAYFYFVRSAPSPAPDLHMRWPGYYVDLTRDYSRDALVNLARYLSPLVVWAAIAGWFATLRSIARQHRDASWAPVLVVILGFSYAYLAGPIPEDHFWVVRRFTPVVIPGFVLCAALGIRALTATLPQRWAMATSAGALIYLCGFTAWAGRLILTFAEDRGYFAQVEQLARQLPTNEVILARGFTEWLTPLYISFDRKVIPLNLDRGAKGRDALNAWVSKQVAAGKPVRLLLEGPADLQGFQVRPLGEFVLTRSFTEPTVDPLPKKIVTQPFRIQLVEITGGP
jgi:hypothetical protein